MIGFIQRAIQPENPATVINSVKPTCIPCAGGEHDPSLNSALGGGGPRSGGGGTKQKNILADVF